MGPRALIALRQTAHRLLRDLSGVDPDDPDWDRAGRDWLAPRDVNAWNRLRARRLAATGTGKAPGSSPGAS